MANEVTFEHPDYTAALPDWELTSDAAAGERAVKAKTDTYLPRPNCEDKSKENRARYDSYIKRAVYYNATGRTLQALAGLAFNKWPEVKAPTALEPFTLDVTGTGVSLVQHAQSSLSGIVKNGRSGVLCDYPRTEGPVSIAQQRSGGMQPTFSHYSARDIINWRTAKRGSKIYLTLVVLSETHEESNGFQLKQVKQYRVLRLEQFYSVEIWRKKKNVSNGQDEWVIDDTFSPLQGNGRPWEEIPFQFIGSQTNDTSIDPAPMQDIAVLNIAHYRNSADYEDGVYMLGQPQAWMSGLDENWVKMLDKMGIYLGSRAILPLPVNGAAGLLQMNENTAVGKAMEQKEQQMAALGARLIMAGGDAPKTAKQVGSEDATSHSVLSLCCDNVSQAYEQLLKWAANFANVTGEIVFSISTEFMAAVVDAPMLTAMVGAVQGGTLPLSEFWARLRSAGIIRNEKTDEQLREEIETQPPPATGGALDDEPDKAA